MGGGGGKDFASKPRNVATAYAHQYLGDPRSSPISTDDTPFHSVMLACCFFTQRGSSLHHANQHLKSQILPNFTELPYRNKEEDLWTCRGIDNFLL